MKKTFLNIFLLTTTLSLTIFGCQPASQTQTDEDTLFPYSTLASLSAGV